MKDFAAIDFETANEQRTSVCSVGVVIVVMERLWTIIIASSVPNRSITLIGIPACMV